MRLLGAVGLQVNLALMLRFPSLTNLRLLGAKRHPLGSWRNWRSSWASRQKGDDVSCPVVEYRWFFLKWKHFQVIYEGKYPCNLRKCKNYVYTTSPPSHGSQCLGEGAQGSCDSVWCHEEFCSRQLGFSCSKRLGL